MGQVFKELMTPEQTDRALNLLEKTVDIYHQMLQKIVIERDKEFNSTPFEKVADALNVIIKEQE